MKITYDAATDTLTVVLRDAAAQSFRRGGSAGGGLGEHLKLHGVDAVDAPMAA